MSYRPAPAPGGGVDVQRFTPTGSYGTIAATSLASGFRSGTGQNATTGTTATITAAASAVLICAVQSTGSTPAAITSVTGLGLVWARLADQTAGTSVSARITLFWAVTTTAPAPAALTINSVAGSGTVQMAYSVTQLTGADTSAPFPQVAGSAVNTTAPTAALGTAPVHTSSRPIAFVYATGALTPRTNWTELSQVAANVGAYNMEVQYRSGAWEATASATTGAIAGTALVVLEVAAAPPTTSFTWTKPAGASMVSILAVMPGGGGGPGEAAVDSGWNRYGGGGGASGAVSYRVLPASLLAATEPVVAGLGGPGGGGGNNASGSPWSSLPGRPGRNGGPAYLRSPKFTGLSPAGGGLGAPPPAVYTTAGGAASAFADGIGPYAQFNSPWGIAVDSAGMWAYVGDYSNNRIRRVHLPTGIVTTLAGSGAGTGSTAGTGATADFRNPGLICLDPSETYLWVIDVNAASGALRRVTIATAVVTNYSMVDANGSAFVFTSAPKAIVCAADGTTLYVTQLSTNKVYKVTATRTSGSVATELAGSGTAASTDGTGAAAAFNGPRGITLDATGTYLYVTDYAGNKVRRIATATAVVTTIAGNGTASSVDNATGTSATFTNPGAVAIDPSGSYLYVVELGGGKLRKVMLSGTNAVSTPASMPGGSGVDGPLGLGVATAGFGNGGIAPDPSDNCLHYLDSNLVRRLYVRDSAAPSQPMAAAPPPPGPASVVPGVAGGAVNTGTLTSGASPGLNSDWGAASGGQGGSGVASTTTDNPGGAGGARGTTAGGAGGTAPGGAGAAGAAPPTDLPGLGGGGGGSAGSAGNAGAGGDGSTPGGGGGGGGAVYGTTRTSGSGGRGGDGLVVVTTW